MNYQKSKEILKKVKGAKKILLNCHRGPDADSIGSALAMRSVLADMDKKVSVVCPTNIVTPIKGLEDFDKIEQKVNFKDFDFSDFDLFITIDSSSWEMVTNSKTAEIPDIPVVVIDHHKTNPGYGEVNLVDAKVTSAAEIIFLILEDWRYELDKKTATHLLSGIIGDTGAFRYPGSDSQTFRIAQELLKSGADKDAIIHELYRSVDIKIIKYWGKVFESIEFDKKHRFIWAAVPYSVYKKYKSFENVGETSASDFFQIVEGTDFGMVITEESKGVVDVSFRSRSGFDTSAIAKDLGGGGHAYASGASVEEERFEDAVEKVLKVARKHAKKNKEKHNKGG
jgi:phosphoesterase RecJ-like protein